LQKPEIFPIFTCQSFLDWLASPTEFFESLNLTLQNSSFFSWLESFVIAPCRTNTLLFTSFFCQRHKLVATQMKFAASADLAHQLFTRRTDFIFVAYFF